MDNKEIDQAFAENQFHLDAMKPTNNMKDLTKWSIKFEEQFADKDAKTLFEMLRVSMIYNYERMEVIKEAYGLLTLTPEECDEQEIDRDELIKKMERQLDGFLVEQPY